MSIEEVLLAVDDAPGRSVLVAKPPFVWGAEAKFVQRADDDRLPQEVIDDGYEYLLELEDIQDLLSFLETKKVSSKTVAEFVIHYALADSPPAWINDIPDR